ACPEWVQPRTASSAAGPDRGPFAASLRASPHGAAPLPSRETHWLQQLVRACASRILFDQPGRKIPPVEGNLDRHAGAVCPFLFQTPLVTAAREDRTA